MLFTSLDFIILILLVIPLYYALAQRLRWMLLLLTSFIFYMNWSFQFLPFLVSCILINYGGSLFIDRSQSPQLRKVVLIFTLLASLSFLFFFKYYLQFATFLGNFFVFETSSIVPAGILFPIGISFYTFQSIGYTLDVYWKRRQAETHLGYFALFVSYFPQLLCGPLEQASYLIPQFKKEVKTDYEDALNGLVQLVFGFFKKLVIADNLIKTYQVVYGSPDITIHSGQTLLLSALFISFVIYFDFSGYCDIAIGLSRILGIKLSTNFRVPYLSKSLKELWERWHITISMWLRNYLMYYLYQKPFFKNHRLLLVLVSFMVLGIWHGFGFNYFLFGFLHGLVWIFEHICGLYFGKYQNKSWWKFLIPLQRLWVLAVFTLLGCLLVQSTERTFHIWSKVLDPSQYTTFNFLGTLQQLGLNLNLNFYLIVVGLMMMALIVETIVVTRKINWPRSVRWIAVYICLMGISLLGSFNQQDFLYYQF